MKYIFLLAAIFFIAACAAPLGTITVHSVNNNNNNKLETPLVPASHLVKGPDTIFKTEKDGSTDGEDVFAIYLTDTYLRYLKDVGGINEVLIVVEFTEAVTGTDSDTITKILGPYNNVADATKTPFLNKALYGPKKMESDLLSMNLKIYEYDLEENDNNAALLEFIASSASALSLANPVTAGEITVVKEIAQTLIGTNENDVVLEIDMDFVAGNAKYKPYSTAPILPLKQGELVIIKQEACRVGTCYDYFSNHTQPGLPNIPGYFTDALMAIPTTVIRATTDVPEHKALTDLQADKISVGAEGLNIEIDGEFNLFKEKTWLRLSIVKGGDASQWEIRKALYPKEEELNELLRNPNALTLENMKRFADSIADTQTKLQEALATIKLDSSTSQNNTHFTAVSSNASDISEVCLKFDTSIDISDLKVNELKNIAVGKASGKSKSSVCYPLTHKSGFVQGNGEIQVTYKLNGTSKSTFFPLKVLPEIDSGTNITDQCTKKSEDKYQINLTVPTAEQISSIKINGANVPFTIQGSNIEFHVDGIPSNITVNGILGGQKAINVSSCA